MVSISTKVLSFVDQLKVSRSEGSFTKIRCNGGFYVDKTKHIYETFKQGGYYFIARPRRFGKSLMCSTLQELFSGNRDLFKGLWIDQSDWEWTKSPVIKLDMSAVAGRGSTKASVEQSLRFRMSLIAEQYEILFYEKLATKDLLVSMIQQLKKKFGVNVVVIVDEYDKPMLDVIDDPVVFEDILGFFKSLYELLKEQTADLRFVFATGVFKFSKVGMFSGANNFTDITFNIGAGTLLGYTQEELEANFAEGIDALGKKINKNRAEMLDLLREKYNGYRFGYELSTRILSEGVYNAFGINNVFAETDLTEKWFESGSPGILMKKLHAQSCEALLQKDLIIDSESLSSPAAADSLEPLPLLYFGGYLTLNACGDMGKILTLAFPNGEVSEAFSKALVKALVPTKITALIRLGGKIFLALSKQKFEELQDLLNQMLAQLGFELFKRTLEENYQLAFHLFFNMAGLQSRVEDVTHDGKIDIIIEMRSCIYIMELKINQAPKKAIEQIKEKDYARKYRHTGLPIWAIGIKLAGKKKATPRKKTTPGKKPVKKQPRVAQKNAVLGLAVELLGD